MSDSINERGFCHDVAFGPYVRHKRQALGLQMNEFSAMLGVSSAYWSHVERSLRAAPTDALIEEVADILELPTDTVYAAAGRLPPDLRGDVAQVIWVYREQKAISDGLDALQQVGSDN